MGNYGGTAGVWGELKVSAAEQAEHEASLLAKRTTDIPSNMQVMLDYTGRTDGQPVYQGFGARGLATSSPGWLIYKFTYSGNNMTVRQTAYDIYDDRADAGTIYA